jgi:hypothetical protein
MYELGLSAATADPPPTVLSATRDYDLSFPNKVGTLVFQFNEDVNVSAAALSLWNETTAGVHWERTGAAPYTATLDLAAGNYSLEMRDTYGDGWNGSNFTIAGLGISFTAAPIAGWGRHDGNGHLRRRHRRFLRSRGE